MSETTLKTNIEPKTATNNQASKAKTSLAMLLKNLKAPDMGSQEE